MTSTLHSITVEYQLDSAYPVMTAVLKYRVSQEETEIEFPTGERRAFKNWDVRGLRERFFCEEIECSEEQGFGIRGGDIQKFAAKLAQDSRYEALFEGLTARAPGGKRRSFPYAEVARMWGDGLTIRQIAKAIGRLDGKRDQCHSMRNFLLRMHNGYKDACGQVTKLPYRHEPRAKKAAA
jgi:hypothetical protein